MNTTHPMLYYVDTNYLAYLHQNDCRVSLKDHRPFVGIITVIETRKYAIPLTSQTTAERKKEGKKKRSAFITTFITETSGNEISNLLYNNMIPVYDEILTPLSIDPLVDTYESNEIRFIRKNWETIQNKACKVYRERYTETSHNYSFLVKTCCDFKQLELACEQYTSGLKNENAASSCK